MCGLVLEKRLSLRELSRNKPRGRGQEGGLSALLCLYYDSHAIRRKPVRTHTRRRSAECAGQRQRLSSEGKLKIFYVRGGGKTKGN